MGVNFHSGNVINAPPGDSGDGGGYMRDLWGMTAKGAGLEPHLEHPDFPGSTSLNIQAGEHTKLYEDHEAARLNAEHIKANPTHYIPPHHEDRPVVSYRTDMVTDNLDHAHRSSNQVGVYATRPSDIQDASGAYHSAAQIQQDLNLPKMPEYVSSVHPDIGTDILASRPISGNARQYELKQLADTWFGTPTPLS